MTQGFQLDLKSGALNLENYSESTGWLGYFESKKLSSRREDAALAIGELLGDLGEVDIWTSCYTIGGDAGLEENHGVARDDINAVVAPLREIGFIKTCDNYREEGPLRKFVGLSDEVANKTCLAMMDVDGIKGHLFLYKRLSGLLAYPHEDIGFGFIAGGIDSRNEGLRILSGFLSRKRWGGRCAP